MLFFGNKDIVITSELAETGFYGSINRILIATNEADIDPSVLSGSGAVDEFKAYLTKNGKTAPKLTKALEVAVGQKDENGNPLTPSAIFAVGKETSGDNSEVYEAISSFDESNIGDFWAITTTFEDEKFEEFASLYPHRRFFMTFTTTDREINDKGKSKRIIGLNTEAKDTEEFAHIAWLARCVTPKTLTAWFFRNLQGITADNVSDAKVEALAKRGWNTYRHVRGKGVTTGSRCTDGETHADTIYIADTVAFILANNIAEMFDQNPLINMADTSGQDTLRATFLSSMQYIDSLKMLSRGSDGTGEYEIYIPETTAFMRESRSWEGITITYQPVVPCEKISITAKEVLDLAGVGGEG